MLRRRISFDIKGDSIKDDFTQALCYHVKSPVWDLTGSLMIKEAFECSPNPCC